MLTPVHLPDYAGRSDNLGVGGSSNKFLPRPDNLQAMQTRDPAKQTCRSRRETAVLEVQKRRHCSVK